MAFWNNTINFLKPCECKQTETLTVSWRQVRNRRCFSSCRNLSQISFIRIDKANCLKFPLTFFHSWVEKIDLRTWSHICSLVSRIQSRFRKIQPFWFNHTGSNIGHFIGCMLWVPRYFVGLCWPFYMTPNNSRVLHNLWQSKKNPPKQ